MSCFNCDTRQFGPSVDMTFNFNSYRIKWPKTSIHTGSNDIRVQIHGLLQLKMNLQFYGNELAFCSIQNNANEIKFSFIWKLYNYNWNILFSHHILRVGQLNWNIHSIVWLTKKNKRVALLPSSESKSPQNRRKQPIGTGQCLKAMLKINVFLWA